MRHIGHAVHHAGLVRREDLDKRTTLLWFAAVFGVPFLGVIAYHAFARSQIPGWMRGALVGGGFALWVLVVGVAAFVGGLV